MIKFNRYHKIPQFRDVVREVNHLATFQGLDEAGQPIYDNSVEKPTIKFKATVKLHGTNAHINYKPGHLKAGKRSSLIKEENLAAHFEFNRFVQVTHKEYFTNLLDKLWKEHCKEGEQIVLYGEFAGTKIQKGVGISLLPRSFYIFDCKVVGEENRWLDISDWKFDAENVYNIHDFVTWEIDIDFNHPQLSQNKIIEITNLVENDCPVSRSLLGVDEERELVGEGVVMTGFYKDRKLIFKSKGAKHSVSKVKTLAAVDPERMKSITEFVDYSVTQNRVHQGMKEVNAISKRNTPDLLKWVANDIMKEESDTLEASALEWKDVAREASNRARQIFFTSLDSFAPKAASVGTAVAVEEE